MADSDSGYGIQRPREWADPRQADVVRFHRKREAARGRARGRGAWRGCTVCAGRGETVMVGEGGRPFAVRCVACTLE
ncbi:hypothetical protein GCM10010218_29680 [Streptomyces mashuensis]|uniref:Uncharacterized protein n=1 Tax=Streptomyces mashuensis TaxID=33904 RepID=A0A919B4B0_9ACTN|nr:hypothetical protein [Streptomyces mashuensis]GHF46467.1 hypothetical protein GCM10010218_29680 [Streptomyces mashuensis]